MGFLRRDKPAPAGIEEGTSLEIALRRADFARDAGDAATAAQHYATVVRLAPDRQDIKVQLGNMLKDSGRLREADAIYGEAQAIDPEDADICIQRGHVQKLLGDRKGALAQYRRAAALNPDSWDAAEQLAELGQSEKLLERYEAHFRSGGFEAVMALSHQVAALHRAVTALSAPAAHAEADPDELTGPPDADPPLPLNAMLPTLDAVAALLPDVLGQTGIPVAAYGVLRGLAEAPPPPAVPQVELTVLLVADRETDATLAAQIAAIRAQDHAGWRLCVLLRDSMRHTSVAALLADEPRATLVSVDADESDAAAEWRIARSTSGWLVLLAQAAVLQPRALAWFAAAPALGEAAAFVTDEDRLIAGPGGLERAAPILRQVVDYDTLLDANVFGETLVVEAGALGRALPSAPTGSMARARSRLLLELRRAGAVGHIPFPLVSRLDGVRASLPEHRLAVADHAAAHGFADRIIVAKGEKGPTHWRPQHADTPITVVVPTRDNAHDLRRLLHALRETAAVPDALHVVVVDTGATEPDSVSLLAELRERRTVSVRAAPEAGWFEACTLGAAGAAEGLLVVARDRTLMQTDRWDERLRGVLDRHDVGAVGARLLYSDDTIEHAGLLLGWRGRPVYDGLYEAADAPGPARRLEVTRRTSAVSAAFLATRTSHFQALGGFDPDLPNAFADLDYALRLRAKGLAVLWTPAVTLRHLASKVRGHDPYLPYDRIARAPEPPEWQTLRARWGTLLDHDPSLHPAWVQATMPFRLLAAPSQGRMVEHLARTALVDPWAVPT